MAKRQFTEEELAFLRRNPYTAYVDENSGVSKKTVNRVLKRAKELNIFWPLEANETDAVLA